MSMTLQHTLEARTKEMTQIRAEGTELWTRLHAPSTLVAERRELRGAVTAKGVDGCEVPRLVGVLRGESPLTVANRGIPQRQICG